MPVIHLLDPELAVVVSSLPPQDLTDLAEARRLRMEAQPPEPAAVRHAVLVKDHVAESSGHGVPVREFRPEGAAGTLPCLLWIQGGGFVLTSPDFDDSWCAEIAERHQCAVFSVGWRRAPEHPFPAASVDCYTAASWLMRNAAVLDVQEDKIVVGGHSSGGGSAATLNLMIRDRGEFTIAHQLLIYPMLDDSNTTASSHRVTDPQLWNRRTNELAWKYYLGESTSESVSPYAAAARMTDLSGLPPATVLTGELDLFVDEDIEYAVRMMAAGVSVELHVYRGAHHGFDRHAPGSQVAQRLRADRDAALARVFAAD